MTSGLGLTALAIAAATAAFRVDHPRSPHSCAEHAGVKGCDGRSWPISTLPRHDRLAFIARNEVSPLLL